VVASNSLLFILSGRHRARGHSQSSPPLGPPLAGRYKATSDGQKQPCSRHWTVMERLLEKSVFRQHFAQKKNIKYFLKKKRKGILTKYTCTSARLHHHHTSQRPCPAYVLTERTGCGNLRKLRRGRHGGTRSPPAIAGEVGTAAHLLHQKAVSAIAPVRGGGSLRRVHRREASAGVGARRCPRPRLGPLL